MSEYMPRIRQYPLELWFPEWRYDVGKAEEVVKRYEELYGVQYYCQLMAGWIYCHTLNGDGGDGNDASPGGKRAARSLKDLIDLL